MLTAYGAGLIAAVLIQTVRPSFQARGDTTTPMLAALFAIAVNIGLKLYFIPHFGVAGLALATSIGAWINFLLLLVLALRGGKAELDGVFWRSCAAILIACLALAALFLLRGEVAARLGPLTRHAAIVTLLALTAAGAVVYFGVLFVAMKALKVPLRRR